MDAWYLASLLKGIKRSIGQPPGQKKPITIHMLVKMHACLNLNSSFDSSFWAICLTAFFGLFRKAHLLTRTMTAFDPSRQFTKSDFTFHVCGAMVHVRWSKTIQFRERPIHLLLLRIPGSILCPVAAILHAFSFTQSGPSSSQAFPWLHHQSLQLRLFTYKNFLYKLHSVLASLGYQETSFCNSLFLLREGLFCFSGWDPIGTHQASG